MDELCDASLPGGLRNLLRDSHEHILKAIVALHREIEKGRIMDKLHPRAE